jgi:predicted TIM-barrel fold metal-dependent hydrolase
MRGPIISADGHIDLPCVPADLFTAYAPARLRDKVPHVVRQEGARVWVTGEGTYLGHVGGVGPHGAPQSKHTSPRIERMAETGLYEDQARGIMRTTIPELRAKDMERDGIVGEVIYGILLLANSLEDPEVAALVVRAYNDFLSEFCQKLPGRFAGVGCLAGTPEEAAAEVRRCAELGLKGAELSLEIGMVPLWHKQWEPVWQAGADTKLPIHLHSIGAPLDPRYQDAGYRIFRYVAATKTTAFQIGMLEVLSEVIWSAALERHPDLRVVLGESGIGWIPYALERMDAEAEQFADLGLKLKPSEYWRRQMFASFQDDKTGIDAVEKIGEETLMWGADFPHPDGTWPDSQELISELFDEVPEATRRKILHDNAARLYDFPPSAGDAT